MSRNRGYHFLTLAILLGSMSLPLSARAQDAPNPTSASESSRLVELNVPLQAAAASARYLLSSSPGLLIRNAHPQTAQTFSALIAGEGLVWGENAWSDLAIGAVQLRRETDMTGETLWYSPLHDAGILVAWVKLDNEWVAEGAKVVLGETIRNSSRFPRELGSTLWLETDAGLAEALEANTLETLRVANSLPAWSALVALPREQRSIALIRANRARGGIDLARGPRRSGVPIGELLYRLTFASPEEADLPVGVQEALERAGTNARRTMAPLAAYQRSDGWSVAFQSPDAPALTFWAHANQVQEPAGAADLPTRPFTLTFNYSFAFAAAQEVTP
jgi:hypothetical protein